MWSMGGGGIAVSSGGGMHHMAGGGGVMRHSVVVGGFVSRGGMQTGLYFGAFQSSFISLSNSKFFSSLSK